MFIDNPSLFSGSADSILLIALSLLGTAVVCAAVNGSPKNTGKETYKIDYEYLKQIFQVMMDNSPCYIYLKSGSPDFRYLKTNKTWVDTIGEDKLGKNDFEIFSQEIAQKMRKQDEQVLQGPPGTVHEFNSQICDKEGNNHWTKAHKYLIRFASGEEIIFCSSIDQTNETDLRLEIKRQEEFLRCILDNIPADIVVKDAENEFRYMIWNKQLELETGIPQDQVIGKTDTEIVPEPWQGSAQLVREFDIDAMKNGEMRHEQWYKTATGLKIYSKTRKKRLTTADGHNYIIDMCIDSTREREAEEQKEEIIAYQKELIRMSRLYCECLTYIAQETNYKKNIKYLLQRFAEEEQADRSYVYRFKGKDCVIFNRIYEYTADGIPSMMADQQNISADLYPEVQELLLTKHEVIIDSVDDMNGCESKRDLQKKNIKSIILIPLLDNGQLRGFVGLDYVQRQHIFSESDLRAMNILAHLIEISYHRDQQMKRIVLGNAYQKQFFHKANVCNLVFNLSGELEQISRFALQKWPEAETCRLNKKCDGYFCNHLIPAEKCPVQKAFKDKNAHRIKVEKSSGECIVYSVMPICNDKNEIIFVVETIDDLSNVDEVLTDNV